MRKWIAAALLAAGLWACPVLVGAEVRIGDVGWQVALDVRNPKSPFHDISQWMFPPSPTVRVRPRIMVKLLNDASRPETAMLLRYAFSARLKRIGDEAPGTWAVPFVVEERHVPRVGPGASLKVPVNVNRVAMTAYLKRMYRAGFWPDAFRANVMVEPRPGDRLDGRIVEKPLPVQWKAGAPGQADNP